MNSFLSKEYYLSNNSLNIPSFIHFNTTLKKISIDDYHELALISKEKGLTKKVIYFYQKAFTLRVSTLGILNAKTISSVKRLAEAYLDGGMIEESLNFYEKSLELNQKFFGKESLEVASCYSDLANIYFREEKLGKAFSFYLKALKIRESRLGNRHPLTAKSQHELGYFYAASEEYTLALPLFEKALETRVELNRLSHPETAKSYNSLAMCHYHLFNYSEAYEYLGEAIRIKGLIFPKNDKRIVLCRKNLSEIKKHLPKKEKYTFFKSILRWIRNL